MHKLGSRLFFSSLVVYLAKPTFLRVIASHCHYMRSLYLMYIYTCVCMSNIRTRVRVCVHQTHGFPGCHLASSCRKTDTFKLGMEVKNLFVCFCFLCFVFFLPFILN